MGSRVDILAALTAVMQELVTSGDVVSVKNTQTDFMEEAAYPVIYVLAGDENRIRRDIGNGYRGEFGLIVRVVVKGNEGAETDVLNPLVESVLDKIDANSSLTGTVSDVYVSEIRTDQGILYPLALAELLLETVYLE